MLYVNSFFGRSAIVVALLLLGHGRVESGPTFEGTPKLRAKEEKAMAATAHILILHAQQGRPASFFPGVRESFSSTEAWHKVACFNAYAALRQCFPENLRNEKDEEFYNNKIKEDEISRFVDGVLKPYGATTFFEALKECAGKLESPTPTSDQN
jgi:hypothetical protein